MGWLKKKNNPLSERELKLRSEIQQLEAQIQSLSTAADSNPAPAPTPKGAASSAGDSGAQPRTPNNPRPPSTPRPNAGSPTFKEPAKPQDQVFETIDHRRLQTPPEAVSKELYNEMGVRKYDLPGAWSRVKGQLRGGDAQNKKFVRLLAAGNIQGLRPLRYEKKVARRRFIAFVVILFLLLWGIVAMFLRH
jgi:hypothetical protein